MNYWSAAVAALLTLTVSLCSVAAADDNTAITQAVEQLIQHAAAHPDGTVPFSFDQAAFRQDTRQLPIGVFDSGIGGLTVLEAILQLDAYDNATLRPGADGRPDFQDERFIYLGDQANMPYGNYPAVGREAYLHELILKDVTFLLGRRCWKSAAADMPVFDKPPVKAIVIACNTATAYGLQDIRAALQAWKIPVLVVGVVEAGARGVLEERPATAAAGTVAVLATVGTCSSQAYPRAIGSALGLAGRRVPAVIQQGSAGLAGAIEGDPAFVKPQAATAGAPAVAPGQYQGPQAGSSVAPLDPAQLPVYGFEADGLEGELAEPQSLRLTSVRNYVRYDVATLVENHRRSGSREPIDTVVLGCTHFPLVQTEILEAFQRLRDYQQDGQYPYRPLIAEQLTLVNPAELTARELFRSLASGRLRRDPAAPAAVERDLLYISVPAVNWPGIRLAADGGLERDYKYGRDTGQLHIEDTRCVPLTRELLPESSVRLIRDRLPQVWQRLQ